MKKLLILLLFPLYFFSQNNHSLNFRAVNYASAVLEESFNYGPALNSDFSVSFWVKQNEGYDTNIISHGLAIAGAAQDWLTDSTYFSLSYQLIEGSGAYIVSGNGNDILEVDISPNFNFYTWHHVALVFNSSGLVNVYINGFLKASSYLTLNENISPKPLKLGQVGTTGSLFDFNIDNIRMWDYPLTTEEILTYMNFCPTPPVDIGGPIRNWDFEQSIIECEQGVYTLDCVSDVELTQNSLFNNNGVVSPDYAELTISDDVSDVSCLEYIPNSSNIGSSCTFLEIENTGNPVPVSGTGNTWTDYVGNEYINFGDFNGFDDVEEFTIQMEFYLDSSNPSQFHHLLVNGDIWDENGFVFIVDGSGTTNYCPDGQGLLQVRMNSTNGINDVFGIQCFDGIDNDTWINIAFTYNDGEIKLYINGLLVFYQISNTLLINTNADLKFGHQHADSPNSALNFTGWNYPFKGKVSNIHLWSKELSNIEIAEYTFCSPDPSSEDLEALWTFQEGSGNIIADLSGNNNDGVILIDGGSWTEGDVNGSNGSEYFNSGNQESLNPNWNTYEDVNCCNLLYWDNSISNTFCDQCDDFLLNTYGFCIIDGGCSDSSALNYSGNSCSSEFFLNENCEYSGCTDSTAFNYNPTITVDDGSCCYTFLENTWSQIGSDLDGENTNDLSGTSLDISENGNIIAVGAPNNSDNGIESGHVRVYEYDGLSWVQMGEDINGESEYDHSGSSISLSSDGTIIAIGARDNDDNGDDSGHVRVYEYNGFSWVQMGEDINGESAFDNSGSFVSINSDGDRVAIGAVNNNNSTGHVRVYEYNGFSWSQIGQDIDGEASGDYSGHAVSFGDNGNILAVSAYGNNNDSGHVRVYQLLFQDLSGDANEGGDELLNGGGFTGYLWSQIGDDIDGENDYSGWSVSISNNGDVVAIGAPDNDVNGESSGRVHIYEYNGTSWVQLGQDLYGESPNDQFGNSVSLSNNGNRIAIGAHEDDGNLNNSGNVRIYEFFYNSNSWIQVGDDIDGEGIDDYSGKNLSLSANGDLVIIGAHRNDGNGDDSGHVRVYELESSCSSPLCGDINLDDQINSQDAALILQFIVGLIDLNEEQIQNGDVNNDTSLNSQDAALILQYIVGLIDEFPGCE